MIRAFSPRSVMSVFTSAWRRRRGWRLGLVGGTTQPEGTCRMLFGDRECFAIECHHEPLPTDLGRVYGRMCIWFSGRSFGDLDETGCMLNVSEGNFRAVLAELDSLQDPSLDSLPP